MRFIAHADFMFNASLASYVKNFFYVWSFQDGALNLDDVLRLLSKLPTLLVYLATGSGVWSAYFYIGSITLLAYLGCFYFLRTCFTFKTKWLPYVVSAFFAVNPIFLSNFSKIGLNLGLAMTPFLFALVRTWLIEKKFVYLLLAVVAMSVSLVHPFVFLVNAALLVAYLVATAPKTLQDIRYSVPRLFLALVFALLLNAGAILSVAALKTVEKSAIIGSIGAKIEDAGSLLEYSNTGSLLNAFVFSREVLLDYDYFSPQTRRVYEGSAFLLLLLLLGLVFTGHRKFSKVQRRLFLISFACLLVTFAFVAGGKFGTKSFLDALVALPGGWAFRSPLKWQLFQPLALVGCFAALSGSLVVQGKKSVYVTLAVAALLFLGLNGYLAKEVFQGLLVPKTVNVAAALAAEHLSNRLVLIVTDEGCALSKPDIYSEVREILLSNQAQVKVVSTGVLPQVRLDDFSYILSCRVMPAPGFRSTRLQDFFLYRKQEMREPVFATRSVYLVQGSEGARAKEEFADTLSKDAYFFTDVESTEGKRLDVLSELTGVFEGLSKQEFAEGAIRASASTAVSREASLYFKKTGISAFVARQGSSLVISQGGPSVKINGTDVRVDTHTEANRAWISQWKNYYVSAGTSFDQVAGQEVEIPSTEWPKGVQVFTDTWNSVMNGSFEGGLWQPAVGDCSKKDTFAALAQSLSTSDRSNGYRSLQLDATGHTACTSKVVEYLTPGEYVLQFDYQSPNAKQASYYLSFDDAKKTNVSEKIEISGTAWKTLTRKVTVPEGATKARLYLYGFSLDDKQKISTRYDNVRLSKLIPVTTWTLPAVKGYEKIPVVLNKGENAFEYKDAHYTLENRISNGSFETGTWREQVGDCRNYDKNPVIGMSVDTAEKTDGLQSLRLNATRHSACTQVTVPVKERRTYLLGFDYQSPNAKAASYYLSFNDSKKTKFSEDLSLQDARWQSFSKVIRIPDGATSLSLYVYAKELDGKTDIVNRYDDVQLTEIPELSDAFYLVSQPTAPLVLPKSVTYELVDPTKKRVQVKGATTPFFLGMDDSYHDQWQLVFENAHIQGWLNRWWPFVAPDKIGDDAHYRLNGFLNGWYVDTERYCHVEQRCRVNPDGGYDLDLVIEFRAQRWLWLGIGISGTALGGMLTYLACIGCRKLFRRLKKTVV